MTVDRFEIKAVIDDLASNKSPGLDGLSAEHFKFAHSILSELLSTLVSSIVVHGHLPQSMNESVIVPIIYYIKLQKSLSVCLPVCLSVPPPPFFSTRPSDRNQIWHTCSGRYGTHSELKNLTQPTPGVISRHM